MKIICVGRNYQKHINELGNKKSDSPVLFLKPETSIIQKKQPFFIPSFTNEVHFEVEILIKISRLGKSILPKFSKKYFTEIGLGIDFTARDIQKKLKKNGLPWEKSKSFDGSALIGKWVNKSEIRDLNNLNFSLFKNGEKVQSGNTSEMIWKIDELISEISKFFTLKIGDIIFTGTPAGVGPISRDDKLTGYIDNNEIFNVKIK